MKQSIKISLLLLALVLGIGQQASATGLGLLSGLDQIGHHGNPLKDFGSMLNVPSALSVISKPITGIIGALGNGPKFSEIGTGALNGLATGLAAAAGIGGRPGKSPSSILGAESLAASQARFGAAGSAAAASRLLSEEAAASRLLSEGAAASRLLNEGAAASRLLNEGAAASRLLSEGAAASRLLNEGAAASRLLSEGAAASRLLNEGAAASHLLSEGAASRAAAYESGSSLSASAAANNLLRREALSNMLASNSIHRETAAAKAAGAASALSESAISATAASTAAVDTAATLDAVGHAGTGGIYGPWSSTGIGARAAASELAAAADFSTATANPSNVLGPASLMNPAIPLDPANVLGPVPGILSLASTLGPGAPVISQATTAAHIASNAAKTAVAEHVINGIIPSSLVPGRPDLANDASNNAQAEAAIAGADMAAHGANNARSASLASDAYRQAKLASARDRVNIAGTIQNSARISDAAIATHDAATKAEDSLLGSELAVDSAATVLDSDAAYIPPVTNSLLRSLPYGRLGLRNIVPKPLTYPSALLPDVWLNGAPVNYLNVPFRMLPYGIGSTAYTNQLQASAVGLATGQIANGQPFYSNNGLLINGMVFDPTWAYITNNVRGIAGSSIIPILANGQLEAQDEVAVANAITLQQQAGAGSAATYHGFGKLNPVPMLTGTVSDVNLAPTTTIGTIYPIGSALVIEPRDSYFQDYVDNASSRQNFDERQQ